MERRVKGGKDRNVKGLKSSKSLQTNTMNHSGSGDSLSTNENFSLLISVFDSKLFCISLNGFSMLIFFPPHPFLFSSFGL